MSASITPGMVVEAVTQRGLSPVIVESVKGDTFSGLILSPRTPGFVQGECTPLLDEIISVVDNQRGLAIRSADDANVGILVLTEDGFIDLYHLDNGDHISQAKTPEGIVKIASRTLERYANDGLAIEEDWSATADQAKSMRANSAVSVRLVKGVLNL